jgi:hypothetical protein
VAGTGAASGGTASAGGGGGSAQHEHDPLIDRQLVERRPQPVRHLPGDERRGQPAREAADRRVVRDVDHLDRCALAGAQPRHEIGVGVPIVVSGFRRVGCARRLRSRRHLGHGWHHQRQRDRGHQPMVPAPCAIVQCHRFARQPAGMIDGTSSAATGIHARCEIAHDVYSAGSSADSPGQ